MRLIKEPLIHFLLIGAALFALFGAINEPEAEADNRIVVSEADVERLAATWQRRWNRPPTSSELDGMIESYIREEILYREAVAMGLEKDDLVVRRRMAQKVEFLFDDIAMPPEPEDAELMAYISENPDKFITPARYSFSHVYLSVDKRGNKVFDDAQQLLAELEQSAGNLDLTQFSDLFMFDYHYSDIADYEVARIFGEQFTNQISSLETGEWQGPIDSGYGVHLVYVQSRIAPSLPPLADIRDRVKTEYISEQQREANQKIYQSMRERYEVVVELPDEKPQSVALGSEDGIAAQ